MAVKVSISKTALLKLRKDLNSYRKYLPSLSLKRQQLRLAISQLTQERKKHTEKYKKLNGQVSEKLPEFGCAWDKYTDLVDIKSIQFVQKSIAGVKVLDIDRIVFKSNEAEYSTMVLWVFYLKEALEAIITVILRIENFSEQITLLESALLTVTQRVNLFEKLLIPQSEKNIKAIELSLGERARESVIVSKLCKSRSIINHDYC